MSGFITSLPAAGELSEPTRNVGTHSLVGDTPAPPSFGTGFRTDEASDGGTGPGTFARAFGDVIDNRVIQLPYCTDLGEFSEDQVAEVVLWNNDADDPVQLIQINQDAVPGIDISGIAVTDVIDQLAHVVVTFDVEGITAGAGDFTSIIDFIFENVNTLEVFTVPVCLIGSRFTPPLLFLANWQSPIQVATRWKSSRNSSRNAVVSRRLNLSRPHRVVDFLIQAMSQEDLAVLDVMIQRNASGEFQAPLYSDHTELTQAADVDDTTLFCSTVNRRFNVGSKVIIGTPNRGRALFASSELRTVISVSATEIEVDSPLDFDHPARARIYPAIRALPIRSQNATLQTDTLGAGRFSIIEKRDKQSLAPLVIPGIASSGNSEIQAFIDSWETFDGRPIMDIQPNWSSSPEIGYQRDGREISVGLGIVTELLGPRPSYTEEVEFTFLTRAAAWRFLRFFDWRGGGVYPFYMISRARQFKVISMDETKLTVQPLWIAGDWQFYPFIGFVRTDGTQLIKGIASVDRVGSFDEVTFDVPFPGMIDASAFNRITTAHLVEFLDNEIQEEWLTDEIVRVKATFVESVSERDVTIDNLDEIPGATPAFNQPEPDGECASIINPVF